MTHRQGKGFSVYLLDTHILIWLEYDVAKIPKSIIELLEQPDVAVYFSMASLFQEIAIKKTHLDIITQLPLHHKDPFDRLLTAQAMAENLTLITHDEKIWQYDNVKILKS